MTMLDANDPAFRQPYPNGAIVRDRLGRQLHGVVACNPVTGEVIRHDKSRIVGAFLRMVRGREQHWELPAEFVGPLRRYRCALRPPATPSAPHDFTEGQSIEVEGIQGPYTDLNGTYTVDLVNSGTITP